jgi:ABC-type dipeptide/oligopeptide/nickel transport system permease component
LRTFEEVGSVNNTGAVSAMLEELSSDYVRAARAKGLSTAAVLFRHAFRNALIPIITILGLQFGTPLAGTIVTETIFSWPGIGRLTVQAISSRDYPLLQGCILRGDNRSKQHAE